jgi:hypothetical protein
MAMLRFPKFGSLCFEAMNETDVREIVVRPIIEALGYEPGAEAYVRSERTLRYGHAFLGRPNPSKDPVLTGRADYECGVTAHARWTIEVKAPSEELTVTSAAQAHTYAAHHEIAAELYLLTNGREFKVYQTSYPDKPAFEWLIHETNAKFDIIENVLGPEAMRKRARSRKPDVGKPLGRGMPSRIQFLGGTLTYFDYRSANMQATAELRRLLQGHRASVTGGEMFRCDDGMLKAKLQIAGHYLSFDEFNRSIGIDGFNFLSAASSVSDDRNQPTIFQCHFAVFVPAGTPFQMPGMPNAQPS